MLTGTCVSSLTVYSRRIVGTFNENVKMKLNTEAKTYDKRILKRWIEKMIPQRQKERCGPTSSA